jgi:hypothetical protein
MRCHRPRRQRDAARRADQKAQDVADGALAAHQLDPAVSAVTSYPLDGLCFPLAHLDRLVSECTG